MFNPEAGAKERRGAKRVEYPAGNRPKITIASYQFEVENISSTGLKFSSDKRPLLNGWQSGTILFTDGESMAVDLIMVSHNNGELGMHLLSPLPESLVLKEQQRVSRTETS